jgi:hypothetical protein
MKRSLNVPEILLFLHSKKKSFTYFVKIKYKKFTKIEQSLVQLIILFVNTS